jgi:hypothetical protein
MKTYTMYVNLLPTESLTRQVHSKVTLKYYNVVYINEKTIGVLFAIFLSNDAKNLYHMCFSILQSARFFC